MNVVLACDLGGSSFRAALIDDRGVKQVEHAVPGPVLDDHLDRSEVPAQAWWALLLEATGKLAEQAPELFAKIQGIAICGVTRTQVFLGHGGQELRPAMTWKDARSVGIAARLRETLADHPEASRINAFHPLARLAWLTENEPLNALALACVLEPKDYLNFRLTGRKASDPVSLARLVACAESLNGGSGFGAIGLSPDIMPAILEPIDIVGSAITGLPAPFDRLAGVPVFCGCNDTWAAVAGLGALRSGYAYNISGTTEVLGVLGPDQAEAEGLISVDWRGLWHLGGPSQNGADTIAWLTGLLGGTGPVGETIEHLLAGQRHPQPLLFLPYLQGERVPYWDPNLRGAFIGLGRRHGPTDLAYAVLEGVACQNRLVLERAEGALGTRVDEIRFGGGAAANPVWAQVKADICGRPIAVGAAKEPGLLGAAIIAWTGLGRFASLEAAQDALVTISRRYEPDPARRPAYNALYALYRQSEAALAPISTNLVALAQNTAALPGLANPESAT
ncbi:MULTISPECIES: FGGY-family carbohydrate kinase [Bosea]|uniref:xylulokinase n=1 Tax=Bosea TaxID=85413 RepID=UPI00214FE892|nr:MULTISPECIES: FGGY-family carbohydrate kinase [Bosea]MCR4522399.1 FGGY-family carbohydrate kinase [Bosea sp. 47.2.35]MDR6829132.1 xylulokinase [Bosea robiniae]MDR6896016.1 xylulokinase [Bosea sp. BE109]MDR7139413.1 xylulokinase [Bosea sp. BE168]MDR7176111.1 xylulokinase [Bosea sp. BE271]